MGVRRPSVRALAREIGMAKSTVYDWLKRLGKADAEEVAKAYIALRKRGIRFYTLPPTNSSTCTPWPWILVNVFNIDLLEAILERYREVGAKIESVIIDAGVDKIWRRPYEELPTDYDSSYWEKFWRAVDAVKSLAKEHGFAYEVVVPDYPDDYTHVWGKRHALWAEECSDYATNIDRTLENIYRVIEHDRKLSWLIPVQGYEDTPQSIALTLADLVEKLGTRRYRYALANLCTSKKAGVITETIRLARSVCNNCSFHVFGPGLGGIKSAIRHNLLRHGDSWDSVAWTYPRGNGWSCKNNHERFIYFVLYLKHVYEAVRGSSQEGVENDRR